MPRKRHARFEIGCNKALQQRKAYQNKYESDLLPPDLKTYGDEAQKILDRLQTKDEKWFNVSIMVTNFGETKESVADDSMQARSIASKHSCDLKQCDFSQEECLASCLPLGLAHTYPKRGLATSAVAVFVPFTTREIFMAPPALYYGLNAISNNIIMADRKKLSSPNGLVLGTPGSGKSFAAKREILINCLLSQDDIIICDPEGEARQEAVA
ncbi:MAG: hypothetical protein LBT59_13380 [Clostridiales bacterium]|nr:hypothetical protein [Clostridiales bacterium]